VLAECFAELIPHHLVIVLNSGGIRGPPGTCGPMELLSYEQGFLELRAVKQSKLRLGDSKPVVSFKRVCHLDEHWRVCWQEAEVGGILRLLIALRTSCLTFTNFC
jgi:hypothetical protein